ncbi:hypothetical protein CFIO01_13740 [Colletotrichum fioriniae PJ7]|uniref:Uncharacterized protein n=1 Tax=Colletotrichum fioriniae PJ7 TaxID=1445577 RepID=A0A010RY08_9PEZI|nr:hypothetical protein CFIO01_13740 [Colletotrichum fioriniae PJ7]
MYSTEHWTQSRDSVRPLEHVIGSLSTMATGFLAETPSDPNLYSNPTRQLPHPHGPFPDRPLSALATLDSESPASVPGPICLINDSMPLPADNGCQPDMLNELTAAALSEAAHLPCSSRQGCRPWLAWQAQTICIRHVPSGIRHLTICERLYFLR